MHMSRIIGNHYENIALSYLKSQGLKLITRNFHSRYGEIDLIMQDKASIVFIEVRYRESTQFGSSVETISYQKQQRIIKTAEYYLLQKAQNLACRFDVVAIEAAKNIKWIPNAFC